MHELDLMNSSHHKILKCIDFLPSHYINVINLDTTSFFSVFSEFNYNVLRV